MFYIYFLVTILHYTMFVALATPVNQQVFETANDEFNMRLISTANDKAEWMTEEQVHDYVGCSRHINEKLNAYFECL